MCKDPDPEDPASLSYAAAGSGFGSIPGRGHLVTELNQSLAGVLEYWKTEHIINISLESNPRLTGFSSFGAQEPSTINPLLPYSNTP
jgi:hypothetical protein